MSKGIQGLPAGVNYCRSASTCCDIRRDNTPSDTPQVVAPLAVRVARTGCPGLTFPVVAVEGVQPELSPADLVASMIPPFDPGADTADRYDWQAAMATADGLALYRKSLDGSGRLDRARRGQVLCEHFEDWCCTSDDEAELVSAKHRDPSVGAYTTIAQLADEGGLRHLFAKWRDLAERPTCRLVTNSGLAAGPTRQLANLCQRAREASLSGSVFVPGTDDEISTLTAAAKWLINETDNESRASGSRVRRDATDQEAAEVCRFLASVRFDVGSPGREHIEFAAAAMYAQPVVDALGIDGLDPAALWSGVHAIFRARMRGRGPVPGGGLPAVLAHVPPANGEIVTDIDRYLASRAVTLGDIDVAVRTVVAHPAAFTPLRPLVRRTRIAIKMRRGGCGDNTIERAEQLRLDFQRYWRDRTSIDSTSRAQQDRLRRVLLRISDRATTEVARPGSAWGVDMWRRLEADVDAMPASAKPRDMDPDLVLGGLCDLANRCQVWFSESFDVAAEIARLEEQEP